MPLDLTQHPCFNSDVRHTTGRIHLPVAPKCNIQCNYCDRKFDCMNESRPGVTSAVLEPKQALAYLDKVLERVPQLKVVGIAGPGDPFATPDETLETLRLVREKYPEMLLCVASNGLNVAPYAEELARLQVSHVTITVNTVDPAIGAKIYSWVRDHKTIYRGEAGGAGSAGAPACIDQGTEGGRRHAEDQYDPGAGHQRRSRGSGSRGDARAGRRRDELHSAVPGCGNSVCGDRRAAALRGQQRFAPRFPADSADGALHAMPRGCRRPVGRDQSYELVSLMHDSANGLLDDRSGRPYVAVASMEGILINQHLGEAEKLWIFEYDEIKPKLVAMRDTPERGRRESRWRELAKTIEDCHSILVSGVGRKPRWVMEQSGLRVIEAAGLIAQAMESLHRSGDVPAAMKKQFKSCGSSGCQGTGTGCA